MVLRTAQAAIDSPFAFIVNTRPDTESNAIASGSPPVVTRPMTCRVPRSKMVTLESSPSLMNPRPSPEAKAMPWTPAVLPIVPTI
jgi:hypothetical protein